MSPNDDRAWKDLSQRFRSDGLPKILRSAVFLSIQGPTGDFDVKQACEIGAALLLGKPLIFVVPKGRTLPAGLRRAADEIVEDYDPTKPGSQDRLMAAIERLAPGTEKRRAD